MIKNAKVLSKRVLYEGHSQYYEYELEVESQNQTKSAHRIKREVLHTFDAVVVLIYAPDIDSFVLCREFRSGVFLNSTHDDPYIFECVAGMIDKNKTPEETARLEVIEEAGLMPDVLKHIASVYSSPGHLTEKTHLFFTEIKGIPEIGTFGLESEGEEITTHLIKREEIFKMMDELIIRDSMTLLLLNWFRANRVNDDRYLSTGSGKLND